MTKKGMLKLSTRMFTARRGRTVLTILGMGIGFGVILFLVSLGYGLQDALLQTVTSAGLDVTANEQDGKFLNPDAVEEIKGINGVVGVEAGYDFKSRLRFGETESDVRAIVASPGYIEIENIKILDGKNINVLFSSAGGENPKKIIVSSAVEKMSGKNSGNLIGQRVSFSLISESSGRKNVEANGYEIAGIADSDEAAFWTIPGGLDIPADIPYTKIKVKVKSSEIMGSVRDAISQKGFSVSSLETVTEVNKLFGVANIILSLFGVITLVVSAIGMFNTMTVTLLERTREIGIMRSIGASRTDIFLMFIFESTLMGFCGGVAGIILGVAAGQVVNLVVNVLASHFGGKPFSLFAYPLWFLIFILVFSFFIGFLTGIGPARRASRLDPLEALRSR